MPKIKRQSAAKKRFKVTGTGQLMRRPAMWSHYLEKKSAMKKRGFDKDLALDESNVKSVKKLLGMR
jgi:large subunit ribosomal protein L35